MGIRILTDEQIKKLSDKSLLSYYKKVRATYYMARLDAEDDFDTSRFKILSDLKDKVKKALETRGHVYRINGPDGKNINSKTKDRRIKNV
jgi:hypothetical protein